MGTESIESSFLSIYALLTFFTFLLVSKLSHKINNGVLLDLNFTKPQAFHSSAVTRSGGLGAMICFKFFLGIYYLLYSKIPYDYLFVGFSMFFIGFLDDLKINIQPFKRLLMMIIILLILIYFLPIRISNIDIPLLKDLILN